MPTKKIVVIVARESKQVQRYLTNASMPLEKCFTEIGFTVHRVRDARDPLRALGHVVPDTMVVDWTVSPGIYHSIEQLVSTRATRASMFVIFYNVPDPVGIQSRSRMRQAQFLGPQFTDRDLFSMVTPMIITKAAPAAIQRSVESAALEGGIAGNSLLEVFQFVEIGHKSGCLLVEDKRPYGIVFFREGVIVYAATGGATGREAVLNVLNLRDGRFRFVLDKEPATDNCSIPTLGILMEWSKELDEAHGR
ncbi:MAG: DUF4388 domain-containing protein [Chitinivibrionales bacterium]|nr:DUF4388 domain-containing protein [Chitinivibrionales bacterium]MBD3397330.1 DUF4388 domain-containing protein [Chitinivibrionales bacterium]